MKTSILALLVGLLLTGCDLSDRSALAASANQDTTTTNATNSPSNVVTVTPVIEPLTTPTPPPVPPAELDLPKPVSEVIRLAHLQLGEGVLTNYIATLREPFQLDSDQIVYLRDVGVSPSVIEALLVKQQDLEPQSISKTEPKPEKPEDQVQPIPPAQQVAYASPVPPTPTQYPGGATDSPQIQVGPAVPAVPSASEEPAPVVNNFNFFYDSLAPYGNWITVPSFGFVWQPSCAVVNPGWRPYWNNGGWVWSDCGWFWNSNYSWGWAPFHYGNWFNSPGVGWCWAPGSVWGPSWVTFRYSSGFCGWAPLPPGCGWSSGVGLTWAGSGIGVSFGFGYSAANYCWTPTSYFAVQNCANFGIVGNQAGHIYNNSQVINNYVVGNNNTIINGGIDPGQIQKHSRSEIRKVQLADANSPTASSGRMLSRPGSTASQLAVYRPAVSQGSAAPRTVVARSEVRPGSNSGASSLLNGDRSRLPLRNQPTRSEPPSAQRVDIPAGSRSPLGSPARLLGRPANQVNAASPTSPQTAIAKPANPSSARANLTPPARTQVDNRYPRFPGQSQPEVSSRLEPRKSAPGIAPSAIASTGPARIPPTMNGLSSRPSVTAQGSARIQTAARTPPAVTRLQSTGTTEGVARAPINSTRNFGAAQGSRPAYSAPTMSSSSRPQFSPGGGGARPVGAASRPAARP